MADSMKPYHIAIIPDGNRRWSKGNKVDVQNGYSMGIQRLSDLMKWCRDYDIKMLSLWGFSTENFSRSRREVQTLFTIFDKKLDEALNSDEYHKNKVKVKFIGKKSNFPAKLMKKMEKLENDTENYSDFHLNILLGYGGRQELVDAANRMLEDHKAGNLKKLTEGNFHNYLYTNGMPDPDLVIRTSGAQRMSGLFPWQAAYSELHFCKKLWPDFSKRDLKRALDDYSNRKRNFGR